MKKILLLLLFLISSVVWAHPILSGEDILTKKQVAVSGDGKKALVVVFVSAKCPCSNCHLTELKELVKAFPEFSFVGVHSNVDEDMEMSRSYFEKAALPFPVLQDDKATIADKFQALKTPHAFVQVSDSSIVYQGGVTNSKDLEKADRKFLREALEDLSAGKKIRTPEGRTLGCVISRGEKHVW